MQHAPQDTECGTDSSLCYVYKTSGSCPQWYALFAKEVNPSNQAGCSLALLSSCIPQEYKTNWSCLAGGNPDCAYLSSSDRSTSTTKPRNPLISDPSSVPALSIIPSQASDNHSFQVRVLAVAANPENGTTNLAEKYFKTSMGNRTAEQAEKYVFNNAINTFRSISDGLIDYQIVKTVRITTFPSYTNGFVYTFDNYSQCVWGTPGFNEAFCESQKYKFDHKAWIRDNRLCEIADENNIDEVWVMSLPYVMTYESFMFGPRELFDVNGPSVVASSCKKNYVVMNPTYESLENFNHIYGHRIESFMSYLTSAWSSTDKNRYWESFSSTVRYSQQNGPYNSPTCGNAHYPANAALGYDYSNKETKTFTCLDWKNFPDFKGVTQSINCTAWGCSDKGWQEYWFSSIPRGTGEAGITLSSGKISQFKKNWWYYLLYPMNAIAYQKYL